MSKLWDFLFKRESTKKKSPYQAPLLREVFHPTFESSEFNNWVTEDHFRLSLSAIKLNYTTKQKSDSIVDVEFFDKREFSGFYIMKIKGYALQDYLNLVQYIWLQTKNQGYITQMSEVKTENKSQNIKTTYRIYLKPSHKYKIQIPADQLYGNIQIDMTCINDKFDKIVVKSMVYSDRNYLPARDFSNWVNYTFSQLN